MLSGSFRQENEETNMCIYVYVQAELLENFLPCNQQGSFPITGAQCDSLPHGAALAHG